jgi:hypothetical protein
MVLNSALHVPDNSCSVGLILTVVSFIKYNGKLFITFLKLMPISSSSNTVSRHSVLSMYALNIIRPWRLLKVLYFNLYLYLNIKRHWTVANLGLEVALFGTAIQLNGPRVAPQC